MTNIGRTLLQAMLDVATMKSGSLQALLAATLFGISPVLAKVTIGEMSPLLLAGLLYLGSGLGLLVLLIVKRKSLSLALKSLLPNHRMKLFWAIVAGGVVAPLCFAYGVKLGSAFEVSLLLNLETVATTLIAYLIFHEHIGAAVWRGKFLLVLGAVLIIVEPGAHLHFSLSGFFIFGACIFWGVDNNLTRDVEDLDPAILACVKGLSAGSFNTLLAFFFGLGIVRAPQILGALSIGAFSYGLSLVLFVMALRKIGAARTSTYFTVGPFVGMVYSIIILGERPEIWKWGAPFLMLLGLTSLLRERHSHSHTHEVLTHSHAHVHDEHHQHDHESDFGPEPHSHLHTHQALTHIHDHVPDIHHRHRH